jgi:hypothetical protein
MALRPRIVNLQRPIKLDYAAPIERRCWKHSRQNTGRPCVGRNGTVVSLPHCEQFVFVSERICKCGPPLPPIPSERLALHPLHLFGSFLNPLSAKNICSPAVKTNSALHSEHFRTRSWYSMRRSPVGPGRGQGMGQLRREADFVEIPTAWACQYPGTPGKDPKGLLA